MDNIIELINKFKYSKTNKIDLIPSNSQLKSFIHFLLKQNTFLFNNVYVEGYPYKRYYEGCSEIDEIETIGKNLLSEIYGYEYVNIQPLSGAIANQIVYNIYLILSYMILLLNMFPHSNI